MSLLRTHLAFALFLWEGLPEPATGRRRPSRRTSTELCTDEETAAVLAKLAEMQARPGSDWAEFFNSCSDEELNAWHARADVRLWGR